MMEQSMLATQTTERRSKPRIACSYPAIVQGWDPGGQKFRANATLTSLSASGLCMVVNSELRPGMDIFVLFRCSHTGPLGKDKAPLIAVKGNIVRSDQPTPGMYAIALKIRRNRFL